MRKLCAKAHRQFCWLTLSSCRCRAVEELFFPYRAAAAAAHMRERVFIIARGREEKGGKITGIGSATEWTRSRYSSRANVHNNRAIPEASRCHASRARLICARRADILKAAELNCLRNTSRVPALVAICPAIISKAVREWEYGVIGFKACIRTSRRRLSCVKCVSSISKKCY